MSLEVNSTLEDLRYLFRRLQEEKMREWGEGWEEDWEGGTTGGQPYPCVYCLWQEGSETRPSYVGETVALGKRLWGHDKATGWSEPRWSRVQYLSHKLLENGQFRQLFECFCICILDPKDNDLRRKTKKE